MKVNGKSKTPITSAQSKKKSGEDSKPSTGRPGGTKARASQQTSRKKSNGVKTAVLERISDGILALDAGMNYTYLNDRAGELLGRSAEELVGKNLREEYAESGRTPFMEACQRALQTQAVVWLNEYFPPTDRWLEGRVYPSQDGVSVLFSERGPAVGKDYGEHHRLQAMSMFPEQNPAPVMRMTPDGQLLYANPASASLLAAWEKEENQSPSLLLIREYLPEIIATRSNREIEIENDGRVFSCLLVPLIEHGYINLYFRDITERKQAEESLRSIVDQASAGIARTDLKGRFTFVNQAFCDMLDYTEPVLTGMTFWEITDGKSLEKSRLLFQRMLSGGTGYHLEKRIIRRNGSLLWASVGVSPVRDAEGHIRGATAVIVDNTRRKRAEESLLDGARRSLFLSSLSDTIRSIEDPQTIQMEAACLLGGHLSASRVVYVEIDREGRALVRDNYVDGVHDLTEPFSIRDFIPAEQLAKFQGGRTIVTADVQSDPRFSESQKAAHEALSVRAQILLPFTRKGQLVAALCIQQSQPRAWKEEELSLLDESAERMRAAIERTQAEKKLRESEQYYRILAETVPSLVWSMGPDGSIQYLNTRWQTYTGLSVESSVTEWVRQIIHPEDFERCRAIWQNSLITGEEYQMEMRLRRYDGEYRWFQNHSIPVRDGNGKVAAWHGVLTDIHERVEKEAELRQVIDNTPFMLTRCSRDLRYQFVSRAAAAMLGTTPQEAEGRPLVEYLDEKTFNSITPYIKQVLQGQTVQFETELTTPGLDHPVSIQAFYVPDIDEQGEIVGWFASLMDVTERKQAESAVRESEQKFNLIYSKLPFTAALLRPEDGVIVDVNEEFEQVFGFKKEQTTGQTFFGLGIEARKTDRVHILAELQRHVSVRNMELELITKPHGPRTFLINSDLVNIAGTEYILQTLQDISERKHVEELLRMKEAELEQIIHHTPFMLTRCTRDLHYRFVSRAYAEMLGRTPEQIAGKPIIEIMGEAGLNTIMPHVESVLQGHPEEYESEVPFEGIGRRFLHVIYTPDYDREGKLAGWFGSIIDLTERRQMEEKIRESEERFRAIISQATAGIAESDLDSRLRFINPRFCEMLGYPEEELLGKTIWELTYTEDLEENRRLFKRMLEQGQSYHFEKRFMRRDGTLLWTDVSVTAIHDLEGKTVGGVGVVIDIDERKKAEQELAEFARQQEALFHLADSLHSADSLQDIFDPSLDAILSGLQCDRASILLFDDLDVMRFVAWRGLSDGYRQATDGHSPWKRDERNAQPIWMNDVATADLGDALRAVIQQEGIGALAFIPLISNGNLIGKFMVYFNQPHVFEEAEIELGQTIAHQLASSIQRKRAEEAIRQSEERFTRFMHHLPGLAWIKDIQGRYVFANATAQKAFNASQEVLYGKTDWEIFPQEVAAQFSRNDDLAVADEKGIQVVETLPQGNGVVHHSLVTKFPIPGPDGRPALIGGTAFDITERIEIEEALKVARTRTEQAAFRMTQLQKVTAALSQALTPAQAAEIVVKQGMPVLGAVSSTVMLLEEEEQILEIIYSSAPEPIIRPFKRIPMSARVPASDAIRLGQPVWMESQSDYLERYPHLAESIHKWGYQAAIAVPMVYKDRALGVLTLSFDKKLPFSLEDQDYILTLARQAAQALERARVEYALRLDATMMENVSAGIYLVRASDGAIIHTNPKFDSLFGFDPGEIIGRHVSVLNAPADISPQEISEKIIDSLRKDGVWQGQILSRRKDGTHFWAFSSVTTFEHPTHGTVWVAARQDISAQKQAEEGLRESEYRYRAIVSQATAGIVRKDPTGRLLFVNQAFCDMIGFTESELKGRRIWEVTHPEDVGENKRLYDRLMEDGTPFQLEKRLIRKNGSTLWVSVSVSPVMDNQGRTNSAVSVYVDVTRRRFAEQRLTLLAQISELARDYDEPDELFYAVSRLVGEHFQAKRTLFNEIDLEHDREIVHRDYCRGVHSVAGVHAISDYSSVTSAEMMAGKTVVNHDSKLDPRTAPDYERTYLEHGERSYVAVPLLREERWVASLWISDDKPRAWDKEDVYLLEAIAERTWTAAEKLRVDRALRDSEERLRVTFNTTVVGIATLRPDTQFIDVNDAFCKLVGYSREELLGMNYDGITHPKFSEATQKQVAQLITGEASSFTIEKIFIRRDGTEIWVQNSLSLVRNADGEPYHLIAISQDITERKRAEEELHQLNLELEERVRIRTLELQAAIEFLRESETTSRLILESMPDAIVIIDRDGQIVHANTQVETLFGYSPDEVMGKPAEILIPQRFREQHIQHRAVYDEQRSRRIMGIGREFFGRRKDESEFPVEVMLAPIDNSTNWDVLVAIRDNTRQREAQEALRNNEEKLRTLFEILPVGISFLDKDGKISELNSALTEIMDLSRSDLIAGRYKARRYIRADGSPMPPSEFASNRARAEKRTIYNVETGIVKENGEVTWTSVNAAPVQVADVEAAVVTIDITERKQAEEALHRHRERLRMLSRRLVEVQEEERHAIARELHDRVGQNLAALTLNLNILRNQLSGEILEKIGTRLNDSVNLVNDILTITRSVMADLRPNVLDDYGLDAALNEYADRFMQRYGIRVITHTPVKATPRLDPGVEMTVLRIAQEALTNIARHAQASKAVITLDMQDDAILMTVEDNGQGILSWQKVNQPGSHGLRIMRERAEAFGGYLKINSAYMNGTTIEVKIPLASSVSGKESKEKRS